MSFALGLWHQRVNAFKATEFSTARQLSKIAANVLGLMSLYVTYMTRGSGNITLTLVTGKGNEGEGSYSKLTCSER